MFLLSSACSIEALFASHPTPAEGRLGIHKELGGDSVETGDPNRPKRHSRNTASCSSL